MNILFAASEVAPFIKTGGLADVAGSLPQALASQGHDVRVVLPLYEGIGHQWREQMNYLFNFHVTLAWRTPYCGVFSLMKDCVTYYFIDNEYYFKRSQIYGHYDDGERFGFFSRAVIELCGHLDWRPDVLHCNDWQTALVPVYLLEARGYIHQLRNTRSVFTIHNIEYQGRYGSQTLVDLFGVNKSYFNEKMLAYHGDVNLMKGAIYAADFVTTVSPTYAQELRYAFYAHGLEGVVADCGSKIQGILNGLDVKLYDPATDPGVAKNFSPRSMAGKRECKAALQRAVGLKEDPNVPVIACVSRLVAHKGFDLVATVIHDIMAMNVQMVVLGTGEQKFEDSFRRAAAQYPGRFSAQIMYSAALSTAILQRRRPLPHALRRRALRSEPDDRHALRYPPHRPGDRRSEGHGDPRGPARRPGLHLRQHQRPRHGPCGVAGRRALPQRPEGVEEAPESGHDRRFQLEGPGRGVSEYLSPYHRPLMVSFDGSLRFSGAGKLPPR